MLIRTHMHDLKDVTCDVHYENYRAHCIQQMTRWATLPEMTCPPWPRPWHHRRPPCPTDTRTLSQSPNHPSVLTLASPILLTGTSQQLSPLFHSKLTQDSRMESPIPILPLPTPDAETEKLIRMKDEEVGGRREGGHDCRVKGSEGEAEGGARPPVFSHSDLGRPTPPAKAHAGDVAEDEAANARPVTASPRPTSPRIDGRFPGWPLHPWIPGCPGFNSGFIWISDGLDLTLIQSGFDQTVQTWSHRATAPR